MWLKMITTRSEMGTNKIQSLSGPQLNRYATCIYYANAYYDQESVTEGEIRVHNISVSVEVHVVTAIMLSKKLV